MNGMSNCNFGFGDTENMTRFGDYFCEDISCDMFSPRRKTAFDSILAEMVGSVDPFPRHFINRPGIRIRMKRIRRRLKSRNAG